MLRAAALKGDPAAAYEIGVRFAEGKGIAANLDEAAKWYDRAAQAGVVPAVFRLGTFYEKGLSVKKDVDIARRYYAQAAERGSAKAMHNLAVLDADGGGKGANYKSASIWFRKAADRGVADSQFNLGILYARGIGVEQNLAESFKWFSLAAAQGDADAGRKRDDIAKRLDVQSLAAARLAIQTFTPEPQPDDAVNVASPAGGWDSAPAPRRPRPSPPPSRLRPSAPPPPIKSNRDAAVGSDSRIAALSSATNPYRCVPSPIPRRLGLQRGSIVDRRQPGRRKSLPQVADRPCGRGAAHPGRPAVRRRRSQPPRRKRHFWSIAIFVLLVSGVGIRAYRDLSQPDAWDYWKDQYVSPSLTSQVIDTLDLDGASKGRRALFVSGTIGPAAANWFREQAGPGPSRPRRHRPAGLSRRRSGPGHDHGRDHPAARSLRPPSAAPTPRAASSRPIAPAPACSSMPAARPGSACWARHSAFIALSQPGPRTTPSRRPSGLPAPCWAT